VIAAVKYGLDFFLGRVKFKKMLGFYLLRGMFQKTSPYLSVKNIFIR
jgi:hypothetical protein